MLPVHSQCTPSVLQPADRLFPVWPSGPAVRSQCVPTPIIPTREAHGDTWHWLGEAGTATRAGAAIVLISARALIATGVIGADLGT